MQPVWLVFLALTTHYVDKLLLQQNAVVIYSLNTVAYVPENGNYHKTDLAFTLALPEPSSLAS